MAVRVDATMEEGWFYEGAGIYRHVWLNKTDVVHVSVNGICIVSEVKNNATDVTAQATSANDAKMIKKVTVQQVTTDANDKIVVDSEEKTTTIQPFENKDVSDLVHVENPTLWDIEHPYLYHLITIIKYLIAVTQHSASAP